MPTVLRMATPQDAAGVLEIYGPIIRETAISFEYEVPSRDEIAARIERTLESHPWIVCTDSSADATETIAGYAYAGHHRARHAYQWSCEVSVYIHENARRRGLARALYQALFGILHLQGFVSIYAGITQPNRPSVELHEAIGMTLVGYYRNVGYKFDQWRDVGWWQMSLSEEPRHAPEPPRPLAAVLETAECSKILAHAAGRIR